MDPGDIAVVMRPGSDLPPAAAALSIAMMAQLRQLAADGPAVVALDNGPAVIELDGTAIIEHPLTGGTGH